MSGSDLVNYEPQTFSELQEFCRLITSTKMVPTAYQNRPEDALVAIMFGRETGGLGPLTSLQFIAVINGRPGYYSDAVPGVALNKGLITDIEEFEEGTPFEDTFRRVCVITKANGNKVRVEFSVGDARRAGLWDKAGPWKQYPRRMLLWRARGYAVRDAAPNMLFGNTVEELREIDAGDSAKDVTPRENADLPERPSGSRLDQFKQMHGSKPDVAPADKPEPVAHAAQPTQPAQDAPGALTTCEQGKLGLAADRTPAGSGAPATGPSQQQPAGDAPRSPTMVDTFLPGAKAGETLAVSAASSLVLREAPGKPIEWLRELQKVNPWVARHKVTREVIEGLIRDLEEGTRQDDGVQDGGR